MNSENQTSRKLFSSQPVGWLMGKFGLSAVLAMLVIAAWNRHTVVVILLGLAMAAAGLSRLWSRFSLAGVSCQRLLSQRRLFPGEHVEVKLRVVNRKLLPLPWLQVDDQMPLAFSTDVIPAEDSWPGTGFLSKSTALLWYTAASWRCELECKKRGYYPLGPMRMTSGDIFGFYPRSVTEPLMDYIIVYPKIFPIAKLGIPSVYPLGETRADRRIFEDPTRTTGIRDYSPYDSLKRIHWKASARHQKLESKIYEPTTTLKVALFLAIDSFPHNGLKSEEDFELGISAAASIASHLTERDCPVGLFVNTRQADSGQAVNILPGSSTNHLVNLLEALAKVTPQVDSPFIEFMEGKRSNLPWGTTLIFVISVVPDSMSGLFLSLKESGFKVMVIQIGSENTGGGNGVAWQSIKHYADLTLVGGDGR